MTASLTKEEFNTLWTLNGPDQTDIYRPAYAEAIRKIKIHDKFLKEIVRKCRKSAPTHQGLYEAT